MLCAINLYNNRNGPLRWMLFHLNADKISGVS